MRWLRLFLVLGVLGVSACSDPTVPKYPDPDQETNPTDPDPGPEKGGFVLDQLSVYWV